MNTIKPAYITLRTTAVNGDHWDLCLDLSPLNDDEILPAVNYLLDEEIDEQYDTPKMAAYIQSVHDFCVEQLMDFCFDWDVYDHCYTIDLFLTMMELGWCCKDCCIKEIEQLERLNREAEDGNDSVVEEIEVRLNNFFARVKPFVFTMI
jgi:hypothetical protein